MIHLVRLIFLTLVSIVALAYLSASLTSTNIQGWVVLVGALVITFAVITLDVLVKKKNLSALSGMMFGILVGVSVSLCIGYLIDQIAAMFLYRSSLDASNENILTVVQGIKLMVGLIITYITTSFVLQTKDDFRFIIPYVEFQRATKGPRPIILDTSVIIDGRIADMAATGMFETTIIVPRFVLNELQTVADSSDKLKRSRGRRGLEVLEKLKALPRLELRFWDGTLSEIPPEEGVDQKLVALAQQEGGRIVTNDYNLNKIAGLRGVSVININSIAESLKPVVLPGESMKVRIIKPGENPGQGVGYMEDGTMVVVEGARDKVGVEIEMIVTNMIQNAAGKMVFGRTDATRAPHVAHPAHHAASPAAPRTPVAVIQPPVTPHT